MRILFSFARGRGHFEPLVPIARAAEAAGHGTAFVSRADLAAAVDEAGFTTFSLSADHGLVARRPAPGAAADREDREDRESREDLVRRMASERVVAILDVCAEWKPDLLVCDEMDFGGMVAAERLGLPYASVVVVGTGAIPQSEQVHGQLNKLRAEHGLPPDPDLRMLSRHLVLSQFPASYRDPAFPLPATGHTFRSSTPGPADRGSVPTVYVTLGTVVRPGSGELFARILEALRELPANLVATVGQHLDPAELGPQPAHVRVERFIPQSEVLPRCDLVVSHAGSGTVLGALAHGLPQVLIPPNAADDPLNAVRCGQLGVARVLDAAEATPAAIREAVSAVLADPAYRRAAERISDEIAAMPGPEHIVKLLEQLVAIAPAG